VLGWELPARQFHLTLRACAGTGGGLGASWLGGRLPSRSSEAFSAPSRVGSVGDRAPVLAFVSRSRLKCRVDEVKKYPFLPH
jgi:hypothetical protein